MNKLLKQKIFSFANGKKVQKFLRSSFLKLQKVVRTKTKEIKQLKIRKRILRSVSRVVIKASYLNQDRELSIKDQTFFAKRLSFLLGSGIPLLESLLLLREQTRKKGHGEIIDIIISKISNGQFLSTALSRPKRLFGEFSINIIRIGETTGILSENLSYLAEELKKKQSLKRKIVGAFIYPAIVTLATLGITIFLVTYLFPKIMPIFVSLHMKLPFTTRAVLWLSEFLRKDGLLVFTMLAAGTLIFLVTLRRNTKLQFFVDKLLLRIPIVGTIIQYYNLANANRTLGILLRSGVPLTEALSITSDTSSNGVYKKEFQNLVETVNRGEKLSSYLATKRSLFPDVLSQIIAVGERSGDLQESLTYLAQFYENEVDDFTKNLSNLVEPVLMVCMGLLVGFIAVSIITPIYGITQNLHT